MIQVELLLAIIALIISIIFSIIGTILSVLTFRARFKPYLTGELRYLDKTRKIIPARFKGKLEEVAIIELKITNVGNGPAIDIEAKIRLKDQWKVIHVPDLPRSESEKLDITEEIEPAHIGAVKEIYFYFKGITGKRKQIKKNLGKITTRVDEDWIRF